MNNYTHSNDKTYPEMCFRGKDGHMYYYSRSRNGRPVRIDRRPTQIVRDVHKVPTSQEVVWNGSGRFILTPYDGRTVKYVLDIKHPLIKFDRILEKISMVTNGDSLQGFRGKALVVYNMIHHHEHYKRGLLVLPFMAYGLLCGRDAEERLPGHVEFHASVADYSQESHLKYEDTLKKAVETIFVPDLAYVVIAYLGFQHEESEVIDMKMLVYNKKNINNENEQYPIAAVHSPRHLQCVRLSERVVSWQGKNFHKGINIRYEEPLSQICVAFWKMGDFPNFLPVLKTLSFQVKNTIAIHSDHKKALIYDKLPYKMHVDEKNPIYTITFSNPVIVETSELVHDSKSFAEESEMKKRLHTLKVIDQLPEGTLFTGVNQGGWLNIEATFDPNDEMMMGIWMVEISRLEFHDGTSAPYVYSYQNEYV